MTTALRILPLASATTRQALYSAGFPSNSQCCSYATATQPPAPEADKGKGKSRSTEAAAKPSLPSRERSAESHGSASSSAPAATAAAAAGSVSNHPRDSLRFADNTPVGTSDTGTSASSSQSSPPHQDSVDGSKDDKASQSKPLTPTRETPLPPTPNDLSLAHHANTQADPLQWDRSPPFPLPRVPFSTHRFVRELERSGVERGLATELMKATRELLLVHEEKARETLLGRQDLENEAYLYTAALSELKTGSQVKSRNDGVALKSMTAVLQRETDAISQKLKEDVQRLHSDIQLDMNNRKEETSQEMKQLDISIMDLNSKFTILLGEVRTEIESVKWISTRRVMTAIIVVVVSVIAYVSSSPAASKADPPPAPPSIEELGVRSGDSEEAELLGDPLGEGQAQSPGTPGGASKQAIGSSTAGGGIGSSWFWGGGGGGGAGSTASGVRESEA